MSDVIQAVQWLSRNEIEAQAMVEHLGGTPWYEAPMPSRFHRCKPQTRGHLDSIERCACGAFRFQSGPGAGMWGDRNSRRRVP